MTNDRLEDCWALRFCATECEVPKSLERDLEWWLLSLLCLDDIDEAGSFKWYTILETVNIYKWMTQSQKYLFDKTINFYIILFLKCFLD